MRHILYKELFLFLLVVEMPTIERKSKFTRSISIHNKRKLRWKKKKSSYPFGKLFFDGKVYKNFSLTVIKKLIKNKSLVEILGEKGIIIGNNKNFILFVNYDNYQNLGTFSLINHHFIEDVELIKFAYSNIIKEKLLSNGDRWEHEISLNLKLNSKYR